MRKTNNLVICLVSAFLLSACTQISQSFKDTFKGEESSEHVQKNKDSASHSTKHGSASEDLVNRGEDEEDESIQEEREVEPVNFLSDSAALADAQRQLLDLPQFKGKDLKFFSSIHFYADGRVNIQLQDPNIPDHIDEYGFRDGQWNEPKPVRLRATENLDQALLPMNIIDFTSVASIFDQIAVKVPDIEGAEEVSHIYFVHSPVFNKKEWYASVSGIRESYSIRADINGKKVSFNRN